MNIGKKTNKKKYKDEIKNFESYKKKKKENEQQNIDYFQNLLAQYAMKKREEDPKIKSQKLPHGYIGFRKKQPKWNYQDDVLLETLKKNQLTDFIKVKEQLDKASIKKAFEVVGGKVINPDTGEVIEGVSVEEQGEDFTVKVSD